VRADGSHLAPYCKGVSACQLGQLTSISRSHSHGLGERPLQEKCTMITDHSDDSSSSLDDSSSEDEDEDEDEDSLLLLSLTRASSWTIGGGWC